MKNGFLFKVHSLAGLISGIFILLISFSGAILVFHDELDQLAYPAISNEPSTGTMSPDAAYRQVQEKYPGAQISHCYLPENSHSPFVLTLYDSSYDNGTEPVQVFLHPRSGVILKTRSARHNFMNWIAELHKSFHLGKPGEWLFGFFALIFLLNTTTGVILYRQNILAVLTFRKRMFRKKHLHQLIGVYALLFNLMIGITGFWMQRYVLKKEFYNATEHKPVFRSSPPLFFSLDSSLRALKNSFPEFTAWVIYFPADKKARTAVYGSRSTNSFIHSKKLADLVLLDSAGRVAGTAFVDEISPSNRYDIINAQLHFGQYGGWTVKVLYCLLGLSGGMLGITGFWFWCKRKKLRLH